MALTFNDQAGRFVNERLDMRPGQPIHDRVDSPWPHTVLTRERTLTDGSRSECGAYGQDLYLGQPGLPRCFAARHPLGMSSGVMGVTSRETFRMQPLSTPVAPGVSPFGDHVSDVISVGSQEEMSLTEQHLAGDFVGARFVIPNAGRSVAGVERIEALGDWLSGCEAPCDPMRSERRTAMPAFTDDAVAATRERSLPEPALISSLDALPETIGQRSRQAQVLTGTRAVFRSRGSRTGEDRSARETGKLNRHRATPRCQPTDVSASRGRFAVSILPHSPGGSCVHVG